MNWTLGEWILRARDTSPELGVIVFRSLGLGLEADIHLEGVEGEPALEAAEVAVDGAAATVSIRARLHRPGEMVARYNLLLGLSADAATQAVTGEFRITQFDYDPKLGLLTYVTADRPRRRPVRTSRRRVAKTK